MVPGVEGGEGAARGRVHPAGGATSAGVQDRPLPQDDAPGQSL